MNKNLPLLAISLFITVVISSCQHQTQCEPQVEVPNAFSPNGDGNKDVLIGAFNCVQTWEIRIYDRWGNLCQVSSNSAVLWGGMDQAADTPSHIGTYVYQIKGLDKNDKPFEKRGNVTLIR